MNLKRNFIDKSGDEYIVEISSTENISIPKDKTYKLQIPKKYKYKQRKKSIFTKDIGIKSEGFIPIITISLIITISVITILFLLLKF